MNFPLWTLAVVLLLIAVRRLGRLRLAIWQIVSAGAVVVLAGGGITPPDAWRAIDWEVLGFLFGVFVLGEALVRSGLLDRASYLVLGRVRSPSGLLLVVLVAGGLASAILMNDTLAVIGTPLMLTLARVHRLPPVLLLLALAYGVTLGSVMSPIGNPQNLLIALQSGIANPFVVFLGHLAVPSLLNLLIAWIALRLVWRRNLGSPALLHQCPSLVDPKLARLAMLSTVAMLGAIASKMAMAAFAPNLPFPLTLVAVAAAAPLLFASSRRRELAAGVDWRTLIFFAALFVLVQAVWGSGALQTLLPADSGGLSDPVTLLGGSLVISQLVSNVPFVALALPAMTSAGAPPEAFLALAAGSTVAGNLTLVGAASNIIIAQSAERRGVHLGFWTFFAIGVPLTAINALVYLWWLG